jgi:hypothetical protein
MVVWMRVMNLKSRKLRGHGLQIGLRIVFLDPNKGWLGYAVKSLSLLP